MFNVCRHRSERRPSSFKANAKSLLFFFVCSTFLRRLFVVVVGFFFSCFYLCRFDYIIILTFHWVERSGMPGERRAEKSSGCRWIFFSVLRLLSSPEGIPLYTRRFIKNAERSISNSSFQCQSPSKPKMNAHECTCEWCKRNLQPFCVYDGNWNVLWDEKKSASCRRSEIVGEAYWVKNEL